MKERFKKIVAISFLVFALTGVGMIFWYNDWIYSLPTPVPVNYNEVKQGQFIDFKNKMIPPANKPLFVHFYTMDCPCSRFNMPHFKSLVRRYENQFNFLLVVMNNDEGYVPRQVQRKLDLDIPVSFDTSLAVLCGVYSTPQAVILDRAHRLYYRGNFNKNRYCTDKNSSFAQMAIDSFLNTTRPLHSTPLLQPPTVASSPIVPINMKNEATLRLSSDQSKHIGQFMEEVKVKADKLMNYFLISFFVGGLILSYFYDTLLIAIEVGGLSLAAYYLTRWLMPQSNLYQYVLSAVLGIFMAQYIYQMHGMFEMHFIAFVSSAILISYQNWKLQIPLTIVVVVHHAIFGYLQYRGVETIFFTKLDYMDLQTFIIHVFLAAVIFFICGLWAYQFKGFNETQIKQSIEIGRLQQEEAQKEELLQSNLELRKSNMELDKFVYSVSHDLRAPLISMLGIVELTRDEDEPEVVNKHMDLLKGSIQKLDGFIKDILDYSRNSNLEVEKTEIDFHQMLAEITNNLKYMGNNNRFIDIRFNIEEGNRFISDPGRLSIIFNNLISNAIRYQNYEHQEPFVDVTVRTTPTNAFVSIKDNGIGIAKNNHDKIFDMFYRVSKKSAGSGLGLYIVKESVDRLEGRIEIKSEPGIGTEFEIHIPNMIPEETV